jgi:uncharacterized RDD family membrane protein YckC
MRCTKCHYLSFEPEARCRNCGHDLSIDDLTAADLPLTARDSEEDPAGNFDLADALMTAPPARAAVALAPSPVAVTSHVTSELPLFVRDMIEDSEDDEPDHEPLVRVPVRPRAPIAVRRTTPDPARLRAKYAPEPDSDFRDLLDAAGRAPVAARVEASPEPAAVPVPSRPPAGWRAPVTAGTRLAAAAIDAGLLSVIAAVVVAFTLRFLGVSLSGLGAFAALPLAAFVLMIAAVYELLFTAAQGQTIGKMAMGIRVVDTGVAGDRITLSQAAVRAAAALPSVLVLGAGFVPALLGSGLAVHDRVAHTRVVRV